MGQIRVAFMRYLDVRFSVGVYISDDVGLLLNIFQLHICQYCSLILLPYILIYTEKIFLTL